MNTLVASVDWDLENHLSDAVTGSSELSKMYQELQEAETDRLRDVTVRSILVDLEEDDAN